MVSCSSTPSLMGDQALRLKEDEDGQQAVAPTHQYHQSSSHAAAANGPSNGRWRTASKRKTPARSPSGSPILRARLAIGETVILTTPLFIAIETPTKGTGGCHQMTVSPTANSARTVLTQRVWSSADAEAICCGDESIVVTPSATPAAEVAAAVTRLRERLISRAAIMAATWTLGPSSATR